MSDITISYKGSSIATMDATGTKTLLTEGKYCEDDITIDYVKSGGGGGITPAPMKDVVFLDYDGTPLYSYTNAEANALSELPANPTHTGLTAQGWNWTLAEIKAQITDCPDGTIDVGQNYVTDDGKSRIYINIPDNTPSNCMTFYVRIHCSAVGNVTIDWGDGNSETNTAIADTAYPHTYTNPGDYMITLSASSGSYYFIGSNGSTSCFGAVSNMYNRSRIKKVELGANMTKIGDCGFDKCYCMKTITIPTTITSIGGRTFQDNQILGGVVVPHDENSTNGLIVNGTPIRFLSVPKSRKGMRHGDSKLLERGTIHATNDNSLFYGCYSLCKAGIPSGVTEITSQMFLNCTSLTELTIPATVSSIGSEAFKGCTGMSEYHFKPTTPPALANSNAFSNIPSGCIIYVPRSENQSVLSLYQNASVWINYSSYIREEPQ